MDLLVYVVGIAIAAWVFFPRKEDEAHEASMTDEQRERQEWCDRQW